MFWSSVALGQHWVEGIKGLFLAGGPLLGLALKRMFVIPTACCGKFIGSLHWVLWLLESLKPEKASGKIYLSYLAVTFLQEMLFYCIWFRIPDSQRTDTFAVLFFKWFLRNLNFRWGWVSILPSVLFLQFFLLTWNFIYGFIDHNIQRNSSLPYNLLS